MTDWARWVIGNVVSCDNILLTCVEVLVICDFEARWPNLYAATPRPKASDQSIETRGVVSRKTPEKIYHIIFGLMQSLRVKGGEVTLAFGSVHTCKGNTRSLKLITQKQWVEEEEIRGRGALSQGCRTESSSENKKRKADGPGTGADGGRARRRLVTIVG